MGSHSRLVVSMLSALIITCLCSSAEADASPDCGLAIYWGREGYDNSLVDLCNSGLYKYVIAAELNVGKILCSTEAPPLKIANIAANVSHCQRKGIKVFVSLTGPIASNSPVDPETLSTILWKGLIEGSGNLVLPFAGSNFDGLDFAFSSGDPVYINSLAEALRKRANAVENRTVYLAATPQCAYPSATLQTAIDNGYFNYVWPNFYDNANCDFSNGGIDGLVSSWNKWINKHPQGSNTKYFMGLPVSTEAAETGYVPLTTMEYEILSRIRYDDLYLGVKLWDWHYDLATSPRYSQNLHDATCDYTGDGFVREEGLKISQVV